MFHVINGFILLSLYTLVACHKKNSSSPPPSSSPIIKTVEVPQIRPLPQTEETEDKPQPLPLRSEEHEGHAFRNNALPDCSHEGYMPR
jgi:hypothetical protein